MVAARIQSSFLRVSDYVASLTKNVIDKKGVQVTETIADCLTRFSRLFIREEGGGIEKNICCEMG